MDRHQWTLLWTFLIVFALVLTVIGVLLFVVQYEDDGSPARLALSLNSISIKSFNLSSNASSSWPEFEITFRAKNPDSITRLLQDQDTLVSIGYNSVGLGIGFLPSSLPPYDHQSSKDHTIDFTTVIAAYTPIRLPDSFRAKLLEQEKEGLGIPFRMTVTKDDTETNGYWSKWSWTEIEIVCDVKVDKLAENTTLIDQNCQVASWILLS